MSTTMERSELEHYRRITAHGQHCFLCGQECVPGQETVLVPCDELNTRLMRANEPYEGSAAHRLCVERFP